MAKFIDYYKILGVDKNIPQDQIKAAYRKRSKQFHPDLHPDDPKAKAKFQMLNEAYDVLSDPDKRARYDQYGEQWNRMGGAGTSGSDGAGPFGGFNPFGGQGGGDPFGGFEFNFGGGGFSDFFSELFRGGGMKGQRQDHRSSQYGSSQGSGGNTDAEATITIDMYQALLGDEIIITVGDEKLRLKIKPGTQPGSKVRLKGKGNQLPNGTRGDLILVLNVSLPTNLTERQKNLVRELRG